MELARRTRERSTLITAVLALLVIGLALLLSTWQAIRQQREVEERHLELSTRAVLLAVENSLRRGPVRSDEDSLTPRTAQLFQELERGGDVLFAGILAPDGGRLLSPSSAGSGPVRLPGEMAAELFEKGEWHGHLTVNGRPAYVYGKRLAPMRGMHHMMMAPGPPVYLVVGVDRDKVLGAYAGYRQSIVLQAVYMLAASVFAWGLGLSFLSRREQARKAAALEQFQAKLIDNLPDGLITLDADFSIRSANPAALNILRRGPEELLGKPVSALPSDVAACLPAREGAEISEGWRRVSPASPPAHLEVLALPLSGDQENAFLLIIRDRTRLRSLEESLVEAEKLAAIGALAAGVAHEVRNPLSSLRGFAQYFVKKLSGRQPEEEYAKTMVREADRLNRVITDLLFFAKSRELAPKKISLPALLREISLLLRFDLESRGVAIHTDFAAPEVHADEDTLKQTLLNLLLNSLDALKEQAAAATENTRAAQNAEEADGKPGELFTTPGASSSPLSVVSWHEEGGVCIEVRDTGGGMTAEQRERAFEAFFTAKKRGTGLGLSLVQRAMVEHGGSARIFSEPGRGCAVRLFFPGEKEPSV